ncbi:MAG: trypsin-like peptidase domain-containing protein [Acidimicrobiales bacterium]|nr:trypsin-like peptidase domain-containing protein [Acidimicrobiales bacterium]
MQTDTATSPPSTDRPRWEVPVPGDEPPPPPTGGPDAGSGRGGWRPLPIIAASVLSAVLASGVTATIVDDDPAPVATTAATSGAATVAPTPVVDGSERAATAAAAIAPAVVQIETRTGVGSGVVYDESGLILTVAHVVASNGTVDVRLADGSTVSGEVLGTHAETDVAVVQIDSEDVPSVAELATGTEPVVGQLAVAVGSPFGFDQTVTSGIVSAVDRIVNDVAMVQTDAAINPGNSGGPLVDASGRVLGLSDVIFTESGGNEGVGFAITVDIAKLIADQIVAGETPQLALLGVSTTASADGSRGAQVAEVVPGSAADAAGITDGDLLVSIDGAPVADSSQLRAQITRRSPGTEVTIGLERDGVPIDVTVTLGSTG